MRCRLLLLAVLLTACGTASPSAAPATGASAIAPLPSPSPPTRAPAEGVTPSARPTPHPQHPVTVPRPPAPVRVVEIRYRVERHVADSAEFAAVVDATLHDRRGWQRAAFRLREDPRASYVVLLVEPEEAQRLCQPYDVYGKYSCQNGRRVVLNAERWRHATPEWTGDLAAYRQMLVNHEFGHLLGQHHPGVQCPRRGRPAPVMAQQSTELNGCLPNPWPLPHEVDHAARHLEPLAPPADP